MPDYADFQPQEAYAPQQEWTPKKARCRRQEMGQETGGKNGKRGDHDEAYAPRTPVTVEPPTLISPARRHFTTRNWRGKVESADHLPMRAIPTLRR